MQNTLFTQKIQMMSKKILNKDTGFQPFYPRRTYKKWGEKKS